MSEDPINNPDIFSVDFSIRTQTVLRSAGIRTLKDLTDFTSRTLLQWRGLGKKGLDEIREKLAFHGLSLRDETIDPDIKNIILKELPEALKEIKKKVDEMQRDIGYFSYKIEQVARSAEKTNKKVFSK